LDIASFKDGGMPTLTGGGTEAAFTGGSDPATFLPCCGITGGVFTILGITAATGPFGGGVAEVADEACGIVGVGTFGFEEPAALFLEDASDPVLDGVWGC
jgi:hypothetical protein